MSKTVHIIYISLFFIVGIAATALLIINGAEYYSTPLSQRFFHESHKLFKPSGILGHGLGITGTLMMIFGVAIYMIRKRVRRFMRLGILKHWLEFHIFLCTLGPIFVLFHTAFKFGGIVSVSFWSMVAVVISGVIGRFIYIRIPRSIQGQELDLNELVEKNQELTIHLRNKYSVPENILLKLDQFSLAENYGEISLTKIIPVLLQDQKKSRKLLHEIKEDAKAANLSASQTKEIVAQSKAKINFSKKIGFLRTMQKLFKYWHVAHLPFAIIMLVIMLIHVGITITFGYRWIF